MSDLARAKEAEARADWAAAAKLWKKLGRTDDEAACLILATTKELGDAWRALPEPRPEFQAWAKTYKGGELYKVLAEMGRR